MVAVRKDPVADVPQSFRAKAEASVNDPPNNLSRGLAATPVQPLQWREMAERPPNHS